MICDGSPPEMVSKFTEIARTDKRISVFELPISERTVEPYRDHLIKKKKIHLLLLP